MYERCLSTYKGGKVMVTIRKATTDDFDNVISSRLEMLKDVNGLSETEEFSEQFIEKTKQYFKQPCQTTILAIDKEVIGCATICYIEIMPTVDHPTGKRAHVMNVYTRKTYRRQGIAYKMMEQLINEARENGVTEISLDATKQGRPLYEKCGFVRSEEGMVLNL